MKLIELSTILSQAVLHPPYRLQMPIRMIQRFRCIPGGPLIICPKDRQGRKWSQETKGRHFDINSLKSSCILSFLHIIWSLAVIETHQLSSSFWYTQLKTIRITVAKHYFRVLSSPSPALYMESQNWNFPYSLSSILHIHTKRFFPMACANWFVLLLLACLLALRNITAARDLPIKPGHQLAARIEASEGLLTCWNALVDIKSCSNEIITFFVNGQADIGPGCCQAISVITHNCWPAMLTSLGFTAEEGNILRGYCDAAPVPAAAPLAASPVPQA